MTDLAKDIAVIRARLPIIDKYDRADFHAACDAARIARILDALELAQRDAARLRFLESCRVSYTFNSTHERDGRSWTQENTFFSHGSELAAGVDSAMSFTEKATP